MMNRRKAVQTLVVGSVPLLTGALEMRGLAQQAPPAPPAPAPSGPFKQLPLPYATDALEPFIDAKTMEIHYGKHHTAYLQNLNKALAGDPVLSAKPIEEILRGLNSVPENVRTVVRNHGGGHANHTLFWQLLRKNNGEGPKGELAKAMDTAFGSYTGFQTEFTKAAMGIFGSGWAWLTLDAGKLRIETTPNQDTPLSQGRKVLMAIDVWEHAYYLKYQNRRADYVAAFYQVIHWDYVSERLAAAQA
jgi:Fe-Mn family superoxide dismutase